MYASLALNELNLWPLLCYRCFLCFQLVCDQDSRGCVSNKSQQDLTLALLLPQLNSVTGEVGVAMIGS